MQRLQTRAQFQAVLAGRTIARTRHFALHCVLLPTPAALRKAVDGNADGLADRLAIGNALGTLGANKPSGSRSEIAAAGKLLFVGSGDWLGTMTPKRWAKRAVTRNAIKRQIYQVSTDLTFQPPSAAYVVRLAAGFDKAVFPSATSQALKTAVRQELVQLFEKAGLATQRSEAA